LAIAGASVLITLAAVKGNVYQVVSTSIYGGTLIFLYAVSTLYHSFQGRKKQIMQKLDHIAIYLLIAGSYTPFTLVTLHGSWGWWLFGITWGLATLGIYLN
jgi:hemolysin III